MKKFVALVFAVSASLSYGSEFPWTSVKVPEALSENERRNFELGVITSSTLLCNYYDLYGQLNVLGTDVIMFERGKATLVRETKKIEADGCRQVLAAASAILTR